MQRETLEIWARVGSGDRVAQRGVQWRIGRTYYRVRELFRVELPTHDEHFPPFVNINQSEVEELLESRLRELDVPVHRGHRLIDLAQQVDRVRATLETVGGEVTHRSAYLVGTDGAHSTVRHAAGIGFSGYTFDDRFLIADIRAQLPMANERHFHFDPPWNPGRQVLIHPQPDGVWGIDWQVPAETDVDAERTSGGLDRRIRAVIGDATRYELVWMTGYRFSQRVADTFRDHRVLLAGDAAHVMSPFGAKGLNSGVADAENLAWKLAEVVRDTASEALLDTYDAERHPAALANLAATDATMRFMAPRGPWRRLWRNLVLRMAPHSGWFRARVDSGRLAEPAPYGEELMARRPLADPFPMNGRVAPDVGLADGSRLRDRIGSGHVIVSPVALHTGLPVAIVGPDSAYGSERVWLLRPDGYVAASVPLDRFDARTWATDAGSLLNDARLPAGKR